MMSVVHIRFSLALTLALGACAADGGPPVEDADVSVQDTLAAPDSAEADDAVVADTQTSDATPDVAVMPAGERTIAGRAYFFDLSDDLSIEQVTAVSGAIISVFEYPDLSVVADDDGAFSLGGLPDGVELTIAMEHPDYFPSLTRTFVLAGEDITNATFQALSTTIAAVAAAIVGVDADDPEVCIMATTVTAISAGMDTIWAVGEPGATVTTEPAIAAEYGPIYFNNNVTPDPSLSQTTADGGVVIAGALEGRYEWYGHKAQYAFAPLTMRCVPGWLTNAAPPYGLVVTSEP